MKETKFAQNLQDQTSVKRGTKIYSKINTNWDKISFLQVRRGAISLVFFRLGQFGVLFELVAISYTNLDRLLVPS